MLTTGSGGMNTPLQPNLQVHTILPLSIPKDTYSEAPTDPKAPTMSADKKKEVSCPVETTLRIVGGRWKVLVLHELLEGVHRFNELDRKLTGISNRTLTRQLRELEADGVIHRKVYREVPPKVEYSLSTLGKTLEPVLLAMHDWGVGYEQRQPKPEDSDPA